MSEKSDVKEKYPKLLLTSTSVTLSLTEVQETVKYIDRMLSCQCHIVSVLMVRCLRHFELEEKVESERQENGIKILYFSLFQVPLSSLVSFLYRFVRRILCSSDWLFQPSSRFCPVADTGMLQVYFRRATWNNSQLEVFREFYRGIVLLSTIYLHAFHDYKLKHQNFVARLIDTIS